MRKAIIFFSLSLIFIGISFGQTKTERERAISIVETLFYEEFYLGVKCYNKIEIEYHEIDNRIEINETGFFGKDKYIETKTSFYLDDIDLTTMKYDLLESDKSDLYFVIVQLDAKDKSIEENSVNTNKAEFPYPTSDSRYLDKLNLSPTGKALPKRLAEKFVENIKIFLGAESYKKASLFK
ncbi:MAG: hypothetical protein Q8O62_05290 [Aequorivita sp.]|nr:hypothetical protein [Aequorivita sp.]